MQRSRRYVRDAARALRHAPAEIAILLVLAVAFSSAVELGGESMRAWLELAIPAGLMLVAAATGTILHATGDWSAARRHAVTLAGAAAAAVYAMFVLDLERAAEGWRAAMFVLAALLWVAAVAVPARGLSAGPSAGPTTVDRVRAFDGRLLLRTFGALLYAGALFAGLALAIGAVDNLFELGLRGEIYGHVFGWIFLVLAPWIVIGGLQEYVRPIDENAVEAVAPVVHRMTAYLIPPLLALYCAILYAYAVRIGVTGEVPKNLVSPMVLAAGVLTALALFLFDDDDVDRGLLRWLRYAPPLFVPLGLLGLWALSLRVGQYGWTEFRLLRVIVLVAFTMLAVAGTALLVRRRRYPLHLVPLTLAGVLVLSAIGPWSVTAISRRSQYNRLVQHLEAVGIDAADVDAPTSPRMVSPEAWEEINNTGRYIATHFGVDELPPVLAARVDYEGAVYNLAATLGLEPEWPDTVDARGIVAQLAENASFTVGGRNVQRVRIGPERMPGSMRAAPGTVVERQNSTLLSFNVAGEALQVDITSLIEDAAIERVPRRPGGPMVVQPTLQSSSGALTGEQAWLGVRTADGARRGDLLVLHLAVHTEDGELRLRQLDGLLFFEAQD